LAAAGSGRWGSVMKGLIGKSRGMRGHPALCSQHMGVRWGKPGVGKRGMEDGW
jgi:hypothetical protein